jgi:hypothetical protein
MNDTPLIIQAISTVYSLNLDQLNNYYIYHLLLREIKYFIQHQTWDASKVNSIILSLNPEDHASLFIKLKSDIDDRPCVLIDLILEEAVSRNEQPSIMEYLKESHPDNFYLTDLQTRYLLQKICNLIKYLQEQDANLDGNFIDFVHEWNNNVLITAKTPQCFQRTSYIMNILKILVDADIYKVKKYMEDDSHPFKNKLHKRVLARLFDWSYDKIDHLEQQLLTVQMSSEGISMPKYENYSYKENESYKTMWLAFCLKRQIIRTYQTVYRPYSYILFFWVLDTLNTLQNERTVSIHKLDILAKMLNFDYIDSSVFSSVQIQNWTKIPVLPDYMVGKYEKISIDISMLKSNFFHVPSKESFYSTMFDVLNNKPVDHFLSPDFIRLFSHIVDIYDADEQPLRSKGWELLNNYSKNSRYYEVFYQQVSKFMGWEYEFLILCRLLEIKKMI